MDGLGKVLHRIDTVRMYFVLAVAVIAFFVAAAYCFGGVVIPEKNKIPERNRDRILKDSLIV